MKLRFLATTVLAIALAPPFAHAQVAASSSAIQAAAVDQAAIQALKDMGAYLQGLKHFSVSTELTGERVLTDGQKLQHAASAVLDVARPDKLRARMSSARSVRELFYDGRHVALYTPAQKAHSEVEFTGSLVELVERLEQRYGIEVPLADLFRWGTPGAPVDGIESAMNAGQDFIGNDLCDHYAFRQGKLDWQVWISAGGKPLPRKLVVTNRTDEAHPQSVSLIDWNLKPGFKASAFIFTPPKGSNQVELRAVNRN